MISLPIGNTPDELEANIHSAQTAYPFSNGFLPHNGMHVYGDTPVKNICDGTIVVCKITDEYDYIPFERNYSIDAIEMLSEKNREQLHGDLSRYFDTKNNSTYTVKRNLSEDEKRKTSLLLNQCFSSNFVLIKHSLTTLHKTPIASSSPHPATRGVH
ncbi:hypothetical protein FACS189462_5150 [Spirochaetia bacterium]|nr:hypothetical protein FACS189462_5150 [Spirochaetia bacterium]